MNPIDLDAIEALCEAAIEGNRSKDEELFCTHIPDLIAHCRELREALRTRPTRYWDVPRMAWHSVYDEWDDEARALLGEQAE